jgi:hypothetical protein
MTSVSYFDNLDSKHTHHVFLMQRFPKYGARPLWGVDGPLGGGFVCMRGIFILNEIWTQHKTYFDSHFACLTYFTHHLVLVLAPNYKQHIFSQAEVKKVCYSLTELYVRSVYLNVFGRTKGGRVP